MKDSQPNIIAFDTSCDDTSVAVLQGRRILSSEVSSQVEIHSQWGGVVPDIARREHEKNIPLVYEEALRKSKLKIEDMDYVVATYGPGLAIDLEIGLQFAKDLAIKYNKPFVPVNHMEGHLLSGLLLNSKGAGISNEEELFPALGLLISGKHTELIYSPKIGQYKKLGETLDDAVGEAFDKVARMLNFGYPGGAIICELAKKGKGGNISFSVPMKNSKDLNFSYSGIKTAALYKTKELRESGVKDSAWVYDFCRGFLDSIIESLIIKLELAIEQNSDIKSLFVGGGVFNSEEIVRKIGAVAKKYGLEYVYPKGEYRGDNAGMVGIAGYYKIQRKEYITSKEDIQKIDREPRLSL
ncbi:MAG TPA: tRNA (adenosine(37)-N6)-threonylcarbamoyltransferase complex transferase subunit TsaD [Candidatus Dojkabacteria bacterium]|nr:tRNA (adenosine(37)-N6)-threonylcarbamoyltransferase complex transferase subunit TsaD [Candidatus Dojkabacteria bacterium]